MNKPSRKLLLGWLVSCVTAMTVSAANVSMTARDSAGTTSFNTSLHWSDGQAPHAGNDYFTAGWMLRTPGDAVTNYTFLGDSLTLGVTDGANGSVLEKYSGGNGQVRWLTINNMTNVAGALLRSGGTVGAQIHIGGNHYMIAGNSTIQADQCVWIIDAPLIGSDSVFLTNNANNNPDHVSYSGNNAGFTGTWVLTTPANNSWNVQLEGLSSLPGNPSTPNPAQILFLNNGQLRDTVGCTYANANGGITLAGNGNINASATTTISTPITDVTNGVSSGASLTASGTGTLVLNNAANSWTGGTIISAGTLRLGVANALPTGNVTATGTLDLNTYSVTIGGLNGAGAVDSMLGGTPTLTLGANNANGSFSGTIQNSSGALTLMKVGTGTQTMTGGFTHSGATIVAGGTMSLNTGISVPYSPGDVVVSNQATVSIDASSGIAWPANNVTAGPDGTLSLNVNPSVTGLTVAGNLTLQNNATNRINYGTLSGVPGAAAINVTGGISAPGASIVIEIVAVGLQTGTSFTLIDYTGTALSDLSNFALVTPPGVNATLVNNTANTSIDINIVSAAVNLVWYGGVNNVWDVNSTMNWNTGTAVYQLYTNGPVISGDGVRFDDTLYNDFVNPQATNISLTATVYPFPFVVDSTLPYSIGGAGSIAGPTAVVKSNTGSLALTTANSFSGGVFINGGSVVVNGDSALGASGVGVTLNGGTLAFSANATSPRPVTITAAGSSIGVAAGATATLSGNIASSAGLTKTDTGTLDLTGSNGITGALSVNAGTLGISSGTGIFTGNPSYVAYRNGTATLSVSGSTTLSTVGELRVGGSDISGAGYDANGTFNMSGGTAYLSAITLARGNNFENTCSGTMSLSAGTVWCTNDFRAGFAGRGTGTLNISGTGTLNHGLGATRWFIMGQWDTTCSSINVSGGNLNLLNNTAIKFSSGGGGTAGTNVFTLSGGAVTYYSDVLTTVGGTGDLNLAQSGSANANNTFNLDGGTLTVPQIGSASANPRRTFNFNGGVLKAARANSTFMNLGSGNAIANVRNGGAIIDDGGFNITIVQALVHSAIPGDNAKDGGLTKNGTGSLTMNAANTYTGDTTVNAGTLLMTTASTLSGNLMISNNATLSIAQIGSATKNIGTLTLNGGPATPGATLGMALTAANNPSVPFLNSGTLTLNGNNTISLAGSVNVGTIQLIKALGPVAGSGTVTNLILPQGAVGSISTSFDGSYTTVSAVITSTGPGLVWTGGTNNVWDINASTNWLLNSTVTTYQQTVVPGDAVTFNDVGSGTVLLNIGVGPANVTVSNNVKSYTISGSGNVTGPASLQKLGTGTAILSLTNNNYAGDTVISGGTLQAGRANALSPSANLTVNTGGTLQLAGFDQAVGALTGSGLIDNNSGNEMILTVGGNGGTWNGTIQDHGAGGVALIKNGTGTWVVGGINSLAHGAAFTVQTIINGGTTILTNGGALLIPVEQTWIGNAAGSTSSVVMAGGLLAVSNNILTIGNGAGATGAMIVNSGTVFHGGGPNNMFGVPNNIVVGAAGSTGTLTVNGGQVLNTQALWLGQDATGSGTLQLNGGLVQATVIQGNNTPVTSIAYFNGGTLQAVADTADFIQSSAMIQSGGLVLDDGGYVVTLSSVPLQVDYASPGGGLTKQGTGTVYLDSAANSYTGTTLINNGTLAGVGTIAGPVVVGPSGNLGAGNAGNIAPLYLSSTPLTVQGKVSMRVTKNGGALWGDQISGISTATYGGTLAITNATSDGTPLAVGDSWQLFSASSVSGDFASIDGTPGAGLGYSFNPATGVLSVIAVPTTPPTITYSVGGGNITINWTADYLGWVLQAQTNTLGNGLGTNWVTVAGSGSVTNMSIPMSSTNPAVFFRLHQ